MVYNEIPNYLYHYFERAVGPFVNLSDLPMESAEEVLQIIRDKGQIFAAKRNRDYLAIRRGIEEQIRNMFQEKGGKPVRSVPHYMTLGSCKWLIDWYSQGCELSIPIEVFDRTQVSFTYGDTFPAMRYQDGKAYRRKVYTLDELPALINDFGLPQDWNSDGSLGPDRYIEAQIWSDDLLKPYILAYSTDKHEKNPEPCR